jgi:hypothetical protein
MRTDQTDQVIREKSERRMNEGFANWFAKPETRLILSSVPSGGEALEVLLRSAYNAGFGSGGADIMISVMESMAKNNREPR